MAERDFQRASAQQQPGEHRVYPETWAEREPPQTDAAAASQLLRTWIAEDARLPPESGIPRAALKALIEKWRSEVGGQSTQEGGCRLEDCAEKLAAFLASQEQ